MLPSSGPLTDYDLQLIANDLKFSIFVFIYA